MGVLSGELQVWSWLSVPCDCGGQVSTWPGRILSAHFRPLEPVAADGLEILQYDPSYYVAYTLDPEITVPAPCRAEIVAAVCERREGASPLAVGRMGYAPTTCPTTPALEKGFYPNAATIASKAHSIVRPDDPPWTHDVEPTLPHEAAFRGPF